MFLADRNILYQLVGEQNVIDPSQILLSRGEGSEGSLRNLVNLQCIPQQHYVIMSGYDSN